MYPVRSSCRWKPATDRVAVEVTAARETPPNRRKPVLPFRHARIRRNTVLDEQEVAAGFEDPPDFAQQIDSPRSST
jgi:hypothetical protein